MEPNDLSHQVTELVSKHLWVPLAALVTCAIGSVRTAG